MPILKSVIGKNRFIMKKIIGISIIVLSLVVLFLSKSNSSQLVSNNIEALTDTDYYLDPSKWWRAGVPDAYSPRISVLVPEDYPEDKTCHQIWKCSGYTDCCKGAGITWYIEEWTEWL